MISEKEKKNKTSTKLDMFDGDRIIEFKCSTVIRHCLTDLNLISPLRGMHVDNLDNFRLICFF